MTLTRSDSFLTNAEINPLASLVIHDIAAIQLDGVTYVYAETNDPFDGLALMRLTSGGDLQYIDETQELGDFTTLIYFTQLDSAVAGGMGGLDFFGLDNVIAVGQYGVTGSDPEDYGLHRFNVEADGSLTSIGFLPVSPATPIYAQVVDDAFTPLVFAVEDAVSGNDVLKVYDYEFSGGADVSSYTLNGANVEANFHVESNGSDIFVFYNDETNGGVHWMEFTGFGTPQYEGFINATVDTPTNQQPTGFALVEADFEGFLITANPLTGLTSYEAGFASNLNTGRALASAGIGENFSIIKAFEINDRGFVLAVGDDIVVYEMDDQGNFYEESRINWTNGDITDVEVVMQSGKAQIMVSADDGIQALSFVPGPGADQYGDALDNTLLGDARENQIFGYGGDDNIFGLAADDDLYGNAGLDIIYGGDGIDSLYGGADADKLYGGTDVDFLYGGGGADLLVGGLGNDTLRGKSGNDKLKGSAGADILAGDKGNDRLLGGNGKDDLAGGTGNDKLFGGRAGDTLKGGGGKDAMYGGSGADTMIGGGKADRLKDGKGADKLTGGKGADKFIFVKDAHKDTIMDWQQQDTINLRAYGKNLDFDDLAFSQLSGGRLKIMIEGDKLIVDGRQDLSIGDMIESDFIFA